MQDLGKLDKSSMKIENENLNDINDKGEYYRQLKLLAVEKRNEFKVGSKKMGLRLVREIYKKEGITIDYQNVKSSRIRASYFCEDGDLSVLVKKSLPPVQRLFDLVHELKHHFVDRGIIIAGKFECGDYNKNKMVEVGAGIFAAEFIFPEQEMRKSLTNFGLSKTSVTPKKVVEYKISCGMPISYEFIKKRLSFFNMIRVGEYDNVKFGVLENQIHTPIYKQKSFIEARKRKRKTH